MTIIDITTPLRESIPTWPGDPAPELRLDSSMNDGDDVNITHFHFSAHTASHVDAPRHFLRDGSTVEEMDLRTLVGPALVVQYSGEGPIEQDFFEQLALPGSVRRLLIRCDRNAGMLDGDEFFKEFVGIGPSGAKWLVENDIRLIGIDYLSIGPFHEGNTETHLVLLKAGVAVLEGLDLRQAEPGMYTLVCLPVAAPTDGAPCRAILLPDGALPDPLDQA